MNKKMIINILTCISIVLLLTGCKSNKEMLKCSQNLSLDSINGDLTITSTFQKNRYESSKYNLNINTSNYSDDEIAQISNDQLCEMLNSGYNNLLTNCNVEVKNNILKLEANINALDYIKLLSKEDISESITLDELKDYFNNNGFICE